MKGQRGGEETLFDDEESDEDRVWGAGDSISPVSDGQARAALDQNAPIWAIDERARALAGMWWLCNMGSHNKPAPRRKRPHGRPVDYVPGEPEDQRAKFALVNLAYEERWNSVAKPVVLLGQCAIVDPSPGGFSAQHESRRSAEDRLVDELAKEARGLHVAPAAATNAIRSAFIFRERCRGGKPRSSQPAWATTRVAACRPAVARSTACPALRKQRPVDHGRMLLPQIAGDGNDLTRARWWSSACSCTTRRVRRQTRPARRAERVRDLGASNASPGRATCP